MFTTTLARSGAFARCAVAAALGWLLPLPVRAAILAETADDVCPASASPCIVTGEVRVADGSRLDFGLRALRIEGAGVLNFGTGSSEVRCGRFDAAVGGAAIVARGGNVALLVLRRCLLAPDIPCLDDAQCSTSGGGPCTGGDGAAVVDGSIAAGSDRPGRITIRAAGDLVLRKSASVAGTQASSDGGALELESTGASVVVAAPVVVSGGGRASGGEFSVSAATDVFIDGRLAATGGDYDGGTVTLAADRHVTIRADVHADSTGGAGFGGEIDVVAGGDITIEGGGPSSFLALGTDGHQSVENFGGDGGSQSFDAGGRVAVSRYVRFSSSGAPPDGFAGLVSFTAGAGIVIDGSVVAKGRGTLGGGGLVELISGANILVATTAAFDVTGRLPAET